MYTFNIVVADDEEIIRSGIVKQLSEEFTNITVSGIYANGTDVIKHLEKNEVDILISDIRMPGATGIEIAKYVKERCLLTKIIVITGYRDFEYAKKLLDYQIYSLLMKPIDIDLLLDTVANIMEEICQKQNVIVNETKQILFLHDLKRQNISSLVFGEKTPDEIISTEYGPEYNSDFLFKPCAIINIIPKQRETILETKINKIMWQDMGENKTDDYEVFSISGNSFKGTFLFVGENVNINLEVAVKQFSENLCKDIETMLAVPCTYTIILYSSVAEIPLLKENDFADIYIECVLYNDIHGRKKYLQTIISGYTFKSLCDVANDLMKKIFELYDIDFSSQKHKFDATITKEEVINILYEIDNIVDKYLFSDDGTVITKITKFINKQIGGEITLDRISDEFNLSKSHISRLFKKKTGENFVEYLNRLRINKAKELIKENKYTIGEISYKVGYTNPRYFGQVFKSVTGMTPSQYFLTNIE